jgi:hypothetical protein
MTTTTTRISERVERAIELTDVMIDKYRAGDPIRGEAFMVATMLRVAAQRDAGVLIGAPRRVQLIERLLNQNIIRADNLPTLTGVTIYQNLDSLKGGLQTIRKMLIGVEWFDLPRQPAPTTLAESGITVSFTEPEEEVYSGETGLVVRSVAPAYPIYSVDGVELPQGTTCESRTDGGGMEVTLIEPNGTLHTRWLKAAT